MFNLKFILRNIRLENSSEFAEEILKYHNTLRALHNSPDLVIDIKLNDFAQEWADFIADKDTLKHRQENDCGENIYVCRGENSECYLDAGSFVQAWYDEISAYEFGEPSPANICSVGHFTQVVWRGSKKLGIGIATSDSGNVYIVCNYKPPGNIDGEFASNVDPVKDDADGLDCTGADRDTVACELDLALARLKAIPEDELRVWLAWLTKVAEVALDEWQPLLQAHTQLAARINDQLLKARREIDEEKSLRSNATEHCARDDIEVVHDLEGDTTTSDAAAATHDDDDDEDKGVVDDKEETTADAEKAEFPDAASIGIVPTTDDDDDVDALKRIPMPRDAEEMLRIVRHFRRQAKKYQSLYAYWQAQADRVMEEIGEKPTAEQVYTHGEIPSFSYLRDEADTDTRIDDGSDDDDDDDDDDDVEMPSGPLERITYRGDLHLFFNLTDDIDGIEEAISDESTKD